MKAFREFGASMYLDPNARPPAGDTDQETPNTVPGTGLEATTRAHAKIIDEVNKLPLTDP